MKTQYLCFPLNIKPTTTATTTTETPSTTNSGRVSPLTSSSLLDRFRVAVFRLIMVTTLSKVTNNNRSFSPRSSSFTSHYGYHKRSTSSSNSNNNQESVRRPSSCYLYDSYHSEALADCIEFIKKQSASSSPSDRFYHHDDDQIARDSTVSHELVIPLPIM